MTREKKVYLYDLIAELNLLAIEVVSQAYFGANRAGAFPPQVLRAAHVKEEGIRIVKNEVIMRHSRWLEEQVAWLNRQTRKALKEGLIVKSQER